MKSTELETIELNEPNKKRGLPFMETLWVKASAREWSYLVRGWRPRFHHRQARKTIVFVRVSLRPPQVVCSTGQADEIVLKASANGLAPAKIELYAKQTE